MLSFLFHQPSLLPQKQIKLLLSTHQTEGNDGTKCHNHSNPLSRWRARQAQLDSLPHHSTSEALFANATNTGPPNVSIVSHSSSRLPHHNSDKGNSSSHAHASIASHKHVTVYHNETSSEQSSFSQHSSDGGLCIPNESKVLPSMTTDGVAGDGIVPPRLSFLATTTNTSLAVATALRASNTSTDEAMVCEGDPFYSTPGMNLSFLAPALKDDSITGAGKSQHATTLSASGGDKSNINTTLQPVDRGTSLVHLTAEALSGLPTAIAHRCDLKPSPMPPTVLLVPDSNEKVSHNKEEMKPLPEGEGMLSTCATATPSCRSSLRQSPIDSMVYATRQQENLSSKLQADSSLAPSTHREHKGNITIHAPYARITNFTTLGGVYADHSPVTHLSDCNDVMRAEMPLTYAQPKSNTTMHAHGSHGSEPHPTNLCGDSSVSPANGSNKCKSANRTNSSHSLMRTQSMHHNVPDEAEFPFMHDHKTEGRASGREIHIRKHKGNGSLSTISSQTSPSLYSVSSVGSSLHNASESQETASLTSSSRQSADSPEVSGEQSSRVSSLPSRRGPRRFGPDGLYHPASKAISVWRFALPQKKNSDRLAYIYDTCESAYMQAFVINLL